MKKKVIAGIVVLAVALGVIAFKPTLAWFVNSGSAKTQQIDLSYFDIAPVKPFDIRSAYTTPIPDPIPDPLPEPIKYVGPGENMIYVEDPVGIWKPGPLAVTNKSTILTNLRVYIEYSWWDANLVPAPGLVTVVYSPTQNADFTVDFADSDNWIFESGYWKYRYGGTTGSIDIPAADPTTGEIIDLINSMGYSYQLDPSDPGNAYNNYKDKEVTVKLTVEAKQAEYGDWTQVQEVIIP